MSKNNQPCYTNGLNEFVVENEIRELLIDAKSLDPNKDLDMKILSREEDYNPNNEMITFKGKYLVFDKSTNSPFKLTLDIKNSEKGYIVNVKTLRYYFWPFVDFLSKLELGICSNKLETRLKSENGCTLHTLLPENSLASTFYSYNKKWSKTIELPKSFRLTKGSAFFKLVWLKDRISTMDRDGYYSQAFGINVIPLN